MIPWVMKDELDVNTPKEKKAGFAGWTLCIQNNGDSIVSLFGVGERRATVRKQETS